MRECHHSEFDPHLSLHAADANQLIQDQKSAVDPVITIHPLLFSQSLIKAFLCLLKGLLSQKRESQSHFAYYREISFPLASQFST